MSGEKIPTIIELNFRDELPRLRAAASKLGDITLRVVEDPNEALSLLRAQAAAVTRQRYPDASETDCTEYASLRWPEKGIGEYTGPDSKHAVTEIQFHGEHVLWDLHTTARHGFVHGITQVDGFL